MRKTYPRSVPSPSGRTASNTASSLVAGSLYDGPCAEDIAITIFCFDFHDQQEQTTTRETVMGAILKQLVVRGEMLEYVRNTLQKAKNWSVVQVCHFRIWCRG